jgi:hypothetical protein
VIYQRISQILFVSTDTNTYIADSPLAVKSMETAVEATVSMKMAPGALPHPGRVPDYPPKFVFDGGGTAELFWEKCRLI